MRALRGNRRASDDAGACRARAAHVRARTCCGRNAGRVHWEIQGILAQYLEPHIALSCLLAGKAPRRAAAAPFVGAGVP